MTCEVCSKTIPKARLKALPETRRCMGCSDEEPVRDEVLGSLGRVQDQPGQVDHVDFTRVSDG